MRVDDLRRLPLFAGLSDDHLGQLAAAATEVPVEPGVVLFREGEPAESWWVLLDGSADLLRHVGREDTVVGRLDVPGRWAGGMRAWDPHGGYLATARGRTPGRMLRVPSGVLRSLIDAWFPFGAHLVAGLYGTARSIEATARQRESLVTLGTLAAGLAHEINNPAAAAVRAVDALEEASGTLLSAVGGLAAAGITPAQLAALDALRHELRPAPELAGLALVDREDELSDWLADHGVDRAWDLAPALAAGGADVAWCARVSSAVGPGVGPAVEWVAGRLTVAALLAEVKESTRRVSDLVAAVRSYSQMDRASIQQVDVTEGIESTLVMLGHKLAGGVEVVRAYGADVPRIDAYAGELNQVWTNLIDNAVYAMGGAGTLRITTAPRDGGVVVEIADSGPGMPAHVAARAFDPFFTTKPVGEGAGLGLDIARRIVVERHGGRIGFDPSRPGETVVRVELPARPPAA